MESRSAFTRWRETLRQPRYLLINIGQKFSTSAGSPVSAPVWTTYAPEKSFWHKWRRGWVCNARLTHALGRATRKPGSCIRICKSCNKLLSWIRFKVQFFRQRSHPWFSAWAKQGILLDPQKPVKDAQNRVAIIILKPLRTSGSAGPDSARRTIPDQHTTGFRKHGKLREAKVYPFPFRWSGKVSTGYTVEWRSFLKRKALMFGRLLRDR